MGALSRRRGCWAHRALLCASATTLLCVALLIACLATATARGHVFEKTFSEPCAAEPCEGKLKEPDGVAVNEATGDLYVVDKGANRVARYDQAGNYLGEFNGSGKLENSKKELFEETEAGAGGKPGETGGSGSNPGERGKATGRFEKPEGIAVDNACRLHKPELSGLACEAFDPSNGDVYVVDAAASHRVIDKYDPEGKYLGQLTAAGVALFEARELDGVAVDPEGRVWVYRETPAEVDGFSNSTTNGFEEVITPAFNSGVGFARPGFAVDSEGAFYVRNLAKGIVKVTKLDHTGNALIAEVGGEESAGVAVEQTNDDSLIENLTSVGVFDPEGRELERLGAGQLSEGQGIGANGASGFLYVADAGAKKVLVFAPRPVEAPLIEDESFSEVSAEGARLAGIVNPRSEAGEAETEYEFQYGRCATASSCAESPYEASTPPAKLPADFESHPVSAEIAGLTPSTTYHFRLLAKNAHGPGQPGAERAFKTEGAGGELILPDNRGFELVSPPDKKGASIEPIAETGVIQAAAGGGAITYLTNTPTEAEPQGYSNEAQVLAHRASSSWSSRDIAIPHSGEAGTGFAVGTGPEDKFFDRELSSAAVQPLGRYFPLSAEASESTAYLHDLSPSCGEACFHPLVTGKPGFANVPEGTQFGEEQRCIPGVGKPSEEIECGPHFANASEDLSHVLIGAQAPLVSGAGEGQLYEWSGGKLAQVSLLPEEGGSVTGFGAQGQEPPREISADGSRVAFASTQALYLRDMSRGETVQLDKLQAGCEEGKECTESGGGRFQSASSDGSRVFFTDTQRLTKDSGAEPGGQVKADLYECQITVGEGGKLACALRDLTPSHEGEGAAVQGGLLGASTDGSYLYFVATGIQSEGKNARGEEALAGQANLYVRHGEEMSFIATLAGGDQHDWEVTPSRQPTRVSSSGQFLALMSERPLSGYDNRDVASGKPTAEVYEYDATSGRLACASCNPTGARPVGIEYVKLEAGNGGLVGGRDQWRASALVAANVSGWTVIALGQSLHQPRYLNDTGRLFFNSANALVPQDANGTQDVYEYEPAGVGSCEEASSTFSASAGGCIALISSGSSAQESAFLDASESGDDVFFLSSAKLSALDVDAARDVYDAHVCTSALPCIQVPSAQPPPCTTEASCKASPTPQPSIFGAPASATFEGPGNPPPAPLGAKKGETKPQKLAKALRACHAKKDKHKRKACERAARKKYGAKAKAKAKRSRHQPKRGLT